MRSASNSTKCEVSAQDARLVQYRCPACKQPMVDPGPPAKWSICFRCPYRIPLKAIRQSADSDLSVVTVEAAE